VSGFSRLPKPAANIIAFILSVTFFFNIYSS